MYDNSESIITKQFDVGINDILTSFKSFSDVVSIIQQKGDVEKI